MCLAITLPSRRVAPFPGSGCRRALGDARTGEARRAVAVLGARLAHFLRVDVAPFRERDQRLGHSPPEWSQRVLDPDRDLGEDSPRDETVTLERAQRVGHDLLGHARKAREEAAVTAHRA